MLKLIVGLKGSGKTKTIVEMANARVDETDGSVVVIEKGAKLMHEIKHRARLLDSDEYMINNADMLYGFVAGNCGSNYDVTDIFIDSVLKICNNDFGQFCKFLDCVIRFTETHNVDFVMTASVASSDIPEKYRKYII